MNRASDNLPLRFGAGKKYIKSTKRVVRTFIEVFSEPGTDSHFVVSSASQSAVYVAHCDPPVGQDGIILLEPSRAASMQFAIAFQ